MPRQLLPMLLTLLLAAGCNAADQPAAPPAVANAAAAAPPRSAPDKQPARARLDQLEDAPAAPEAAPDPGAVTRAWFAGRWTDTGNCTDAGQFAANGTYYLADGTRGMWNVRDGKLVVQHARGRSEVGLRRVDDRTVEVVNSDGSVGRSIRC